MKKEIEQQIRQAKHEIQWVENKIKSLPLSKHKQIKDLERQIKEREYNIMGLELKMNDIIKK
jgi:hypothetical protein